MPTCKNHPGVETNVTCVTCAEPICPECMVDTPVGYKCPEDADPHLAPAIRPKQWLYAIAAALGVGLVGGWALEAIVARFGFLYWIGAFFFGALVGEATRRAAGGHRARSLAFVAAAGASLGVINGGLVVWGGPDLIGTAIAGVAAILYVLSRRLW
jgi:hypothetical protein